MNLKPFKAMLDMHYDMAGSAVALGTLLAISKLRLPIAVDCWLAITENRLSNEAYKSRDIVTASNGTTIEVIHTDAEGRMALADTLVFASRSEQWLTARSAADDSTNAARRWRPGTPRTAIRASTCRRWWRSAMPMDWSNCVPNRRIRRSRG